MNIVQVSDHARSGGAAIAAARLAEGFVEAGSELTRIIAYGNEWGDGWATHHLRGTPMEAVIRPRLNGLPGGLKWTAREILNGRVERVLAALLKDLDPDVINLHNLHGARWRPALARVCAEHAPTFWTLHDMWSFTGRCAYSADCERFKTGCSANCPTPNEYPALPPNRIAEAWEDRREVILSSERLHAVTPSRWLAEAATAGLWPEDRVHVVPNGIDTQTYEPVDRREARQALGLDPDLPTVLAVATDEPRKGALLLDDVLLASNQTPFQLVSFGPGSPPAKPGTAVPHHLGFVTEAEKITAINAADVYLHAAPVDNLPNLVLEALACGTPTLAFDIGGVPDMVRPGETGWLVGELSPVEMAAQLDDILAGRCQDPELRTRCRAIAIQEYTREVATDAYFTLFENADSHPS